MLARLAIVALLAACPGGGEPRRDFLLADAPQDTHNPNDGPPGGVCSTLTTTADIVPTVEPDLEPMPSGGGIDDGIYDLVRIRQYEGEGPPTFHRMTLQITGSRYVRSARRTGDTTDQLDAGDTTIAGLQLSFSDTCSGSFRVERFGYSASPTLLQLFSSNDIGWFVLELERR